MRDHDLNKPMDPDAPLPFELDGWVDLAPYERSLGMVIQSSGGGRAVLTMPFTVKLAQGKGLLHGDVGESLQEIPLADFLFRGQEDQIPIQFVSDIKTLLPEDTHFATVEMTTRFLAPVRGGIVTAKAQAEIDEEDKRIYRAEVFVIAENEAVVAEFWSEYKVAKNQR